MGVLAVAAIVVPYTAAWTNSVRAPLDAQVSAQQQEIAALQQAIAQLQDQIARLQPQPVPPSPPPFGIARALYSNGTVLPIGSIQDGWLLIRQSNTIVGVDPDSDFIDKALGYVPENRALKGVPNGYPTLDGMGLVPPWELPAAAFVHFFYVNSTAALATLTAAVVSDYGVVNNPALNQTGIYVLAANPPTVLANWLLLTQPGGYSGSAFVQGGNSFGATAVLGTLDDFSLYFMVNNSVAVIIDPGNLNYTIFSAVTYTRAIRANGVISSSTLNTGLVASDASGDLINAVIGLGLSLTNNTLENTGVVALQSNSSSLTVMNDGGGIWSLLVNINGTSPSNASIEAGIGINVATPTPSLYVISNTGVLNITSPDQSILIQYLSNGTVAISAIGHGNVSSITTGAGLYSNSSSGSVFLNNTGVLYIESSDGSVIIGRYANGTVDLQVNHTASVSGLSAGPGISLSASIGFIEVNNTGVLTVESPDLSILVTSYPNGTIVLSTNRSAEVFGLIAGPGISLSNSTGMVQVNNTGLLFAESSDLSISITLYPNGTVDLVTNRTAEVAGLEAGPGIAISASVGLIQVNNTGVLAVVSPDGSILIDTFPNGTLALITNLTADVSSLEAGPGIALSSTTGHVQINNTGVLLVQSADGTLLVLSYPNGTVDLSTNRSAEVSGLVAGPGIALSASVGLIEVNNTGVLTIGSIDMSIEVLSYPNGTVTLSTNRSAEVAGLVAGPGISLSAATGFIQVNNTGVLAVESSDASVTVTLYPNGTVDLMTNHSAEVASLSAGPGIAISSSVGDIQVNNTGVLMVQSPDGSVVVTTFSNGTVELITNHTAEVSSLVAGTGIALSASVGDIQINNTGVLTAQSTDGSIVVVAYLNGTIDLSTNRSAEVAGLLAGPGIALSGSVGLVEVNNTGILAVESSDASVTVTLYPNGTVDLMTNRSAEVASLTAGPGISLSSAIGDVQINNTGVLEVESSDFSLQITAYGNGTVDIMTNRSAEVSGLTAGPGISLSASMGFIQVNNTGVLAVESTDLSIVVVSMSNGTVDLSTNRSAEVSALTAGPGISLSASVGLIEVNNTGVLQVQSTDLSIAVLSYGNGTIDLSTNRSAEVASLTAGPGIALSASIGDVQINNTGVLTVESSDLSLVITTFGNGTVDLSTNRTAEVAGLEAGPGISISASTGLIQVNNTGVLSIESTDASIIVVSFANGTIDLATNRTTEVASLSPGPGIALSSSTGDIQINNTGILTIESTDLSISVLSYGNGTINLSTNTSAEVASLLAGPGIALSSSTGNVQINNTGLLSAIAGPGTQVATSEGILNITNTGVIALRTTSPTLVVANAGFGTWTIDTNSTALVTSIQAGPGISVNATTSTVLVSNTGLLSAVAGPGTQLSTSNGVLNVTNTGVLTIQSTSPNLVVTNAGFGTWSLATNSSALVTSIQAGQGISVNSTTSTVLVSNTGLLSAIAGPGTQLSTSNGVLNVTNIGVISIQSSSPALTVSNNGFGLWTLGNNATYYVLTVNAGTGISVNETIGNVLVSNTGLLSAVAGPGITTSVTSGVLNVTNSGVITLAAGSGIGVAQGANGLWTITNTGGGGGGVTGIFGGSGISVNSNTGSVTVTNTGVLVVSGGTGIAVSTGGGTATVTNNGVTQAVAGTGIQISSSTGSVTFTNNGVLSLIGGVAISVSGSGGAGWTINNGGVTALSAGTGMQISSSTGSVTLTNIGVTSLGASGAGISVSSATGNINVFNTGVTSMLAGSGVSLSRGTGTVTVTNTVATKAFHGSTTSTTGGAFTINHGLGSTPVYCAATAVAGVGTITANAAVWAAVDLVTNVLVSGHVLHGVTVVISSPSLSYDGTARTIMVYCTL